MKLLLPQLDPVVFAEQVLEQMQRTVPQRLLDTTNGSMINLFAHSFAFVLAESLARVFGDMTFDESQMTDMDVQTLEGIWISLGEIIDRKKREAAL